MTLGVTDSTALERYVEPRAPAIILETKSEEYIRDQVVEVWAECHEAWRPQYEKQLRHYRLYRSWTNPSLDPEDWRSNLFIPIPFSLVETVEPRVMAAYYGRDDIVHVRASGRPEFQRNEEAVETWTNYQLLVGMRHFRDFGAATKSALIYGNGRMKVGFEHTWEVRPFVREPISVTDPFTGEKVVVGSRGIRNKPVTIHQGPYARCVDNFDWCCTPDAGPYLQDADAVFEVTRRSMRWLFHQAEQGTLDPDKVGAVSDEDAIHPETDEFYQRRLDIATRGYNWSSQLGMSSPRRGVHHVLEAQMWLDLGLGKYRKVVAHVVDLKHLVQVRDFDFPDGQWTYLDIPYSVQPNELHAIGLVEQVEQLAYAINDQFNMAHNHSLSLLHPSYLMDPTLLLNPDQFEARPGGVHPVEAGGLENGKVPVELLQRQDLPQSYFDGRGFLVDLTQRVTGVTDYLAGSSQRSGGDALQDTVGGLNLMAQQAATRVELWNKVVDHHYWKELCPRLLAAAQAFMDETSWVRVTGRPGQDWYEITPDSLLGSFDFAFNSQVAQRDEQKERADFIAFYDKLLQAVSLGLAVPVQMGGNFDFDELHRRMFELLGQKNIDQVIRQQTNPLHALLAGGGIDPAGMLAAGIDPLAMASQFPDATQLPAAQGAAGMAGMLPPGVGRGV